MGVLCTLGFHIWEYITTGRPPSWPGDGCFRWCQRCGKWQSKVESDRKWQNPGMNIEGGYTTWDEMKASIYEEAEGLNQTPNQKVIE